jgi:glycosyltransferase involved in cell wall biosynthesis
LGHSNKSNARVGLFALAQSRLGPGFSRGASALNIVTKAHVFYTQHGLWRTLLRATERLTNVRLLPVPQVMRSDGRATTILNANCSAHERRVAHVTPGSVVVQPLGVHFDEIFEIELRLELSPVFQSGAAVLVSEKGEEIYREMIEPQRLRNGTYSILFDKALAIPDAARLRLLVWNSGRRGALTLGLATDFDGQLTAALQHPVPHANGADLASLAGEGSALRAPLALRVAGRSSSEHATYHRAPIPRVWQAPAIEVKGVYASGLDPAAMFQTGKRLKEATVDAIRFDDSPRDATSVLLLGVRTEAQQARELVSAARRRFIPVVAVLNGEPPVNANDAEVRSVGAAQLVQWADLVLVKRQEDVNRLTPRQRAVRACPEGARAWINAVREWLPAYRRQILPRFSIVTILYNKAAGLAPVLHSYFLQNYEGEFEVVFVDDASPDDSAAVVERIFAEARTAGQYARLPSYKLIRNPRNMGNCVSRNIGLAQASGDIAVVIDADCMLNRDFLRRHAQAHSFGDTDVVIGPLNIETENEDPLRCLQALEAQPSQAARRTQLQDEFNRTSFVNCITRNFSIRTSLIEPEFFDPAFSYTADPSSGFGWEDVEMGYRVYKRGLRIKYVSDAFSIHITHDPAVADKLKPVRSARNFRRLLEKHPDLRHEARQWVRQTTKSLRQWFEAVQVEPSEDLKAVETLVPPVSEPAPPLPRKAGRRPGKLNVLTYRWHVPHQYELYKLGHDFSLVRDLGTSLTATWELRHRPLPDNARFISRASIRESDFDLAIVHFDENVLSWENCNGILGEEWGAAFRWFMENVKLPKIAICHGTPQFYGQYNPTYETDQLQVIEPARQRLVDYLGDTLVICNSHQAQREWGFRRSRVIWHGFDPTEFPPATYERGILSPLGPLVFSRPHYRGYFLYKKVFADFPAEFAPSALSVPDPCPLYHGNQFARWKYRNYVDEIRRYSVYFNPTQRSPMPRARAEPMMCGVATVSAKNHDVDMFIQNGVNGFYSEDPQELREQLLFLSKNPVAAKSVGAAGRRTAIDLFNVDRYLADWRSLIHAGA